MRSWFKSDTFTNINWRQRFFYMLLFASIFSIIGYFLPKVYLQYFDKTPYVDVIETVSFDKKVYAPCDTAVAKLKVKLSIDSKTQTSTRLLKILTDKQPPDNFQIIDSTNSENFVIAQPEVQTYFIDYPIPCNLPDGAYLFRAEIRYWVNGVEKNEPFETALFSIDSKMTPTRPHNKTL